MSELPVSIRPLARQSLLIFCMAWTVQALAQQAPPPDDSAPVLRLNEPATYEIDFSALNNGDDPLQRIRLPVPFQQSVDLGVLDSGYDGQILGAVTLGAGSASNNLGPSVDVQVSAAATGEDPNNLPFYSTSPNQQFASGGVTYRIAVIKLHPDAPDDIFVPINFTAAGEATIISDTIVDVVTPRGQVFNDFRAATATATAGVAVTNNFTDLMRLEACAGVDCSALPESFNESGSFELRVIGDVPTVTVGAGIDFAINSLSEQQFDGNGIPTERVLVVGGGSVDAQVLVSGPVFSLDDAFQVDFQGSTTSVSNVFTVAVSQGIGFTGNFPTTSPFVSGCQPDPSVGGGLLAPLADGSAITCTANDPNGFLAANNLLDINVLGDATVATTEAMQPGIVLSGSDNDLINDGEITTTGDESTAVLMVGARNNVTNNNLIETSGADASAIALQVPDPATGSIGFIDNQGTLRTTGPGSDVVRIEGNNADVRNGGLIEATNASSDALTITGNDGSLINDGDIRTLGSFSDAISVSAEDENFEEIPANGFELVSNGSISTGGIGSVAINLNANDAWVQNAGTISTGGDFSPAVAVIGADAEVENLGTISTVGELSVGIGVIGPRAKVTSNGPVTTEGTSAFGIASFGAEGSVTNDQLGEITTEGDGAHGITFGHADAGVLSTLIGQNLPPELQASAGTVINLGDITTTGDGAHGINVFGSDTTVTNEGDIEVSGALSHGVVLDGVLGTRSTDMGSGSFVGSGLRLVNSGRIDGSDQGFSVLVSTSGVTIQNLVTGVIDEGILIDGSTKIINDGTINRGISDLSNNRVDVENLAGGTINGLVFGQSTEFYLDNAGTIEGRVETGGDLTRAEINNSGTINAAGDETAIAVLASGGPTTVSNSGNLTGGTGIGILSGAAVDVANSGAITVAADDGDAIKILQSTRASVLNEGQLNTAGDRASGIEVAGNVSVAVTNTGQIGTTGDQAAGITLLHTNGGTSTLTNSGSIATAGAESHGVFVGTGNADVVNDGGIMVDQDDAFAVAIGDLAGSLNLTNRGTLTAPVIAVRGSFTEADTVINSGRINGTVDLLGGNDRVTLEDGGLFNGVVDAGADTDTLTADISGAESLVGDGFQNFEQFRKTGAGVLALSGLLQVTDAVLLGGTLNLADATIMGNTQVSSGAVLGGNGSITGSLNVDDGGVVGPGFSPGLLEIDGDLILDGLLAIEIGGTGPGLFDQIIVAGDLIVQGGQIAFDFITGFLPGPDDLFEFLTVGGAISGLTADSFLFSGLPAGFEFSVDVSPGALTFSAAQGPSTSVSEPGTLALLGIGLLGLVLRRGYRRPPAG